MKLAVELGILLALGIYTVVTSVRLEQTVKELANQRGRSVEYRAALLAISKHSGKKLIEAANMALLKKKANQKPRMPPAVAMRIIAEDTLYRIPEPDTVE